MTKRYEDSHNSSVETPEREFQGIWIPAEIWLHPELTFFEKALWAEIKSLSKRETGCTATNSYFMQFFGAQESTVRNAIGKLKRLGLVEQVDFDGRIRTLNALAVCPLKIQRSARLKSSGRPLGTPTPPYRNDNKEDNRGASPPPPPPDASRRLCSFFFEELKKSKPNTIAQEHSKKAQDASKQLLRVRTEVELRKTILEAFKHDFWKTILTSIEKLKIHLDAIELAIQQKPQGGNVLEKNRRVLRNVKEKYPNEEKYGVRYEPDAIIFCGGAVNLICQCSEADFLDKIAIPLKNRKMEYENG